VDFTIEQWINAPAGSHAALDEAMKAAAGLAEYAFVALVGAWFLIGWLRQRPSERRGVIAALGAAAIALLTNQVIGLAWNRPRPFMAHPASVHVLLSHGTDPSFPSDHAAAAFAIAVVLLALHRRLGIAALLGAALMCYARVYVGDHYPGDVIAGALVGAAAAVAVLTVLRVPLDLASRLTDHALARLHLLQPGT
jgi:undecaprenyl-diphosphatase